MISARNNIDNNDFKVYQSRFKAAILKAEAEEMLALASALKTFRDASWEYFSGNPAPIEAPFTVAELKHIVDELNEMVCGLPDPKMSYSFCEYKIYKLQYTGPTAVVNSDILRGVIEAANAELSKKDYIPMFDKAIEVIRDSQSKYSGEEKPSVDTDIDMKELLISALTGYKEELVSDVNKNKVRVAWARKIASDAYSLAATIVDPDALQETKESELRHFQVATSSKNNARIALVVLGALIVGAALGTMLFFCPAVGIAALLPLWQQVMGLIGSALVGLSIGGLAVTDAPQGSRRDMFFKRPVLSATTTNAVMQAAEGLIANHPTPSNSK